MLGIQIFRSPDRERSLFFRFHFQVLKFDVRDQTRTNSENIALNYRYKSEKKEFKVIIEVNDKICNKCECKGNSQDVDEKSERRQMDNTLYGDNQSQRNIFGQLHEDQSGVQEVDIECRVAGEEISLHIKFLCLPPLLTLIDGG